MESHPEDSEVYSIRLRKARLIAREMGGQKALAIALDRDPSQISSIIGKTPRDRIGGRMARRIEAHSNGCYPRGSQAPSWPEARGSRASGTGEGEWLDSRCGMTQDSAAVTGPRSLPYPWLIR